MGSLCVSLFRALITALFSQHAGCLTGKRSPAPRTGTADSRCHVQSLDVHAVRTPQRTEPHNFAHTRSESHVVLSCWLPPCRPYQLQTLPPPVAKAACLPSTSDPTAPRPNGRNTSPTGNFRKRGAGERRESGSDIIGTRSTWSIRSGDRSRLLPRRRLNIPRGSWRKHAHLATVGIAPYRRRTSSGHGTTMSHAGRATRDTGSTVRRWRCNYTCKMPTASRQQ